MPLGAILGGMNQANNALFSASAAEASNRQSRAFSREMYDRTKTDNLAFWNLQNEYNSPQSQMKRYQEAGLNPNLIYGQGNSGNAGSIPTPDVQPVNFRTPEVPRPDMLTYLNAFADLDIKGAQADNLKAQNGVIHEDILLKQAQRANLDVGRSRSQFDLDLESELRPFSADYRREQVRQLRTSTDLNINRDAREAASNSVSVKEAFERIISMKEQRANTVVDRERLRQTVQSLEKDNIIKQLDIDLRRMGVQPSDPMWSRILGRVLSSYFEPSGKPKSSFDRAWNFMFK